MMRGASLANVVWKLDFRAKDSIRRAVGSKSEGRYVFTSDKKTRLTSPTNEAEESEPNPNIV